MDGSILEHVPCQATIQFTCSGTRVEVEHYGFHDHAKPHAIRPDAESMAKFKDVVDIAPEVRPKNLLIGTKTRPPITDIHPSFSNLDRIAYLRRKHLQGTTSISSIGALASLEKELGIDLIHSGRFKKHNGHISLQTKFMAERTAATNGCMQSDSIHGFFADQDFDEVNVAFTSSFCPVILGTIPLVISVMFGKSQQHYEQHFLVLLKSLPFKTWEEFSEGFPGTTCDFSDAERAGFESAIRRHYGLSANEDIQPENHNRFCTVHFKRYLTRLRRNGAVVSPEKEMEFYHAVLELLQPQLSRESFDRAVLLIQKDYRKVKNWMAWQLHPSRGKHIFPAMATDDFPKLFKDTNAQESLGGDFQKTATSRKVSIGEVIEHAYRYMSRISLDYALALKGMRLRYENPKKRAKAFHNEGRAPNTTDALLSRSRAGRPKGSRNKVLKLGSDIDWSSFGIPWGFTYQEFQATNTCPLDTSLMAWYLLERFAEATLPAKVQQTYAGGVLQSVLKEIASENYNRARWLWCTYVMKLSEPGSHDLFSSLERVPHRTSLVKPYTFITKK